MVVNMIDLKHNNETSSSRRWTRKAAGKAAALALALGLTLTACTTSNTTVTPESQETTTSSETASSSSTTEQTISSTAAATEAFLATLSDEQRETVVYDYNDETKSTSWSNFPVTFVQRAGLNLHDLTEEQQEAAMAVLEALLNDESYATVVDIMTSDQYLNDYSSSTESSLGQYYIAFFGDPSESDAWSVQFGGHHIGVNADLNGSENAITFAPTHLGLQPAIFTTEDGEEVQAFEGIYADAFAFFDSLTDEQQATLTSGEVSMCSPGDSCDFPTGDGLSGSELSDEQKQLLLDLIANWAAMADDETNAAALAEIETTLDDTVIAWSGETVYDLDTGDGISFSISGPNVYIGFQAQSGSANADVDGVSTTGWGHVHTIYRDPTNDYAGSVTQDSASGGMGGGPGGEALDGAPSGGPPDGAPSGGPNG